MPKATIPTWQSQLTSTLCQDPKKTGVLGFLILILLIVSSRMMIGGGHPSAAAGATAAPYAGGSTIAVPTPAPKLDGTAASLREWLSTPIPSIGRNDFRAKSEYCSTDSTKTARAASDSSFWSSLSKSLSVQADQKEKRDAAIADLKRQAAALRPTSTVMGPSPRAMIDGVLVREGDTVASFRVIRIEPLGIVVERQGIRLAVPMN
jgi:hypothetical protein